MARSNRTQLLTRWLAGLQGLYYLVTRAALHLEPLALMVAALGLTLGYTAIARRVSSLVELAALTSAATLVFIDLFYVTYRTVGTAYVVDAVIEAVLAASWLLLLGQRARRSGSFRSHHA
jgi:hypothetical protein